MCGQMPLLSSRAKKIAGRMDRGAERLFRRKVRCQAFGSAELKRPDGRTETAIYLF
jgi:hypothetical protein